MINEIQAQIEILKQQIIEKDNQIKKLQDDMSKIIDFCFPNPISMNKSFFFIPVGESWEMEDMQITKWYLRETLYGSIHVTVNHAIQKTCSTENLSTQMIMDGLPIHRCQVIFKLILKILLLPIFFP